MWFSETKWNIVWSVTARCWETRKRNVVIFFQIFAAILVVSALHQARVSTLWYTHTHLFNGPLSGTTQVSRYQKVKPIFAPTKSSSSELEVPANIGWPVLRLYNVDCIFGYILVVWLGSRVVSVLDSGAKRPGFKSQPQSCRVTILGKLFTPIVPLSPSSKIGSSPLKGCEGNCGPGGK